MKTFLSKPILVLVISLTLIKSFVVEKMKSKFFKFKNKIYCTSSIM